MILTTNFDAMVDEYKRRICQALDDTEIGSPMIDRIPNPKRSYPPPGSPAEAMAIDTFGTDSATTALFAFGPDNTGAAIAALCCALGTVYRMLPPVAEFYGSPEQFAAACRVMIAETAAGLDDASPPDRG